MAFGPIMQMTVGDLQIELAPLTRENVAEFINPGMQQASINKYLARRSAPVLEDEQEWYDRVRTEKNSLTWGIYVVQKDGKKVLIGDTTLMGITKEHIHQAITGSMIFRKEYWGKGIASSIHKARTWYAFQHLGIHRIQSAVIQGNVASLKALQKSGYELVYIERNTVFVDGSLRHQDNLECLNPREPFWGTWWHSERPPKRSLMARQRTIAALAWAEQYVTLL